MPFSHLCKISLNSMLSGSLSKRCFGQLGADNRPSAKKDPLKHCLSGPPR
jgi:hypothetical protein